MSGVGCQVGMPGTWSKIAMGMASVAHALGMSTMPDSRPSHGQHDSSRYTWRAKSGLTLYAPEMHLHREGLAAYLHVNWTCLCHASSCKLAFLIPSLS